MTEPSKTGLAEKHCVPCSGDVPALKGKDLHSFTERLPQWSVVAEHHLFRSFGFPDFKKALAFVNSIGEVAEQEGHHPDICLTWGKVEVTIFTHKIKGLSESDFVLAAKIDRLENHT